MFAILGTIFYAVIGIGIVFALKDLFSARTMIAIGDWFYKIGDSLAARAA